MADRFDKFTERARLVLHHAQEEAQRFSHNYIGTEHLLLGLVRQSDGVAAKVLANLGVELAKVRSAVEFIIGRGEQAVLGEIGLTPRSKRVIELAVDEARRLNHRYIGTEHLLLGLVREGEGIAAGVLESLGVSLGRVRSMTTSVLTGMPFVDESEQRTGWQPLRTAQPHSLTQPDEHDGPPSLKLARMCLEAIRQEKDGLITAGLYEQAAVARDHQVQMEALVRRMEQDWRASSSEGG